MLARRASAATPRARSAAPCGRRRRRRTARQAAPDPGAARPADGSARRRSRRCGGRAARAAKPWSRNVWTTKSDGHSSAVGERVLLLLEREDRRRCTRARGRRAARRRAARTRRGRPRRRSACGRWGARAPWGCRAGARPAASRSAPSGHAWTTSIRPRASGSASRDQAVVQLQRAQLAERLVRDAPAARARASGGRATPAGSGRCTAPGITEHLAPRPRQRRRPGARPWADPVGADLVREALQDAERRRRLVDPSRHLPSGPAAIDCRAARPAESSGGSQAGPALGVERTGRPRQNARSTRSAGSDFASIKLSMAAAGASRRRAPTRPRMVTQPNPNTKIATSTDR